MELVKNALYILRLTHKLPLPNSPFTSSGLQPFLTSPKPIAHGQQQGFPRDLLALLDHPDILMGAANFPGKLLAGDPLKSP